MELFSILNNHIPENGTVIIVVAKTGDRLTASIALRNEGVKDPAKDYIQPLALCGTPEELDENFEKEIVKPIEQSAGLQSSMKEFEAAQQVAAANSKAKADEKKQKAEAAKKKAAAQKAALDAAKSLVDAKKWSEAAGKYREILANEALELSDSQKASVKKMLESCESRDGGLFGSGDIDIDITEFEVIEAQAEESTDGELEDMPDDGENNTENDEN